MPVMMSTGKGCFQGPLGQQAEYTIEAAAVCSHCTLGRQLLITFLLCHSYSIQGLDSLTLYLPGEGHVAGAMI